MANDKRPLNPLEKTKKHYSITFLQNKVSYLEQICWCLHAEPPTWLLVLYVQPSTSLIFGLPHTSVSIPVMIPRYQESNKVNFSKKKKNFQKKKKKKKKKS